MTEEAIRDIIEGVRSGKYALDNLPFELFKHTSNELVNAFEQGWNTTELSQPDVYSKDIHLFNSLRDNIWYFSGNKSAAQVAELQQLLHDKDGNRRSLYDYTKDALKVDSTFNRQYLAAEYDLTFKLAQSGREWKEIEETKETFPFLEWVTVMDDNTRHGKLNGIKLPVDDPFWQSHPQPLEWGCRCRKRQLQEAVATSPSVVADIPAPPERPWHANVYKEKAVWKNEEHPYHEAAVASKTGAEQLVIKQKELYPEYTAKRLKNGAVVNVSAHHFADEIDVNAEFAAILKRNHGRNIQLPPHHKAKVIQHYKNPDHQDADTLAYGDLKQPEGLNGIQGLAKKSVNRDPTAQRNPSFLVYDLDFKFEIFQLSKMLKGTFKEPRNSRIKEVFIVNNGRSVLLSREDLQGSITDVFKKVRKIKSGA